MSNLITADVLTWIKEYKGPPFHAMITDAPYHLESITDRFGKEGSAPAQAGTDGAFSRVSRGFMNQEWDGGDIAFRADTWEAFSSVLYPGAFCAAFASSRGWHRMACAIEDAGFIIHPSIFLMGWVTGQGFPKATNPVKGARRNRGLVKGQHGEAISNDAMVSLSLEKRAYWRRYELALVGHRYGAQAVKPAMEPIIIFQKPYSDEGALQSIAQTGAGTLNIDAARLATHGVIHDAPRGGLLSNRPDANPGSVRRENELGRWPANFVLVHHPGCQRLGSIVRRKVGGDVTGDVVGTPKTNKVFGEYKEARHWIAYGNEDGTETVEYWECHDDCQVQHFGGDSRFYYQADWAAEVQENLFTADPVRYEQKATSSEREAGLDDRRAKAVNDGRTSSIDNPYQRGDTERLNIHPTVKPLALTRWLSSLLLPAHVFAPRRVFVPFAGVASEMIGAVQAGWEEVTGVELGKEYAEIGRSRLKYWTGRVVEENTTVVEDNQLRLF